MEAQPVEGSRVVLEAALVPDIDDLCPNEEALEGQDDDEDGCTDAAKPAG